MLFGCGAGPSSSSAEPAAPPPCGAKGHACGMLHVFLRPPLPRRGTITVQVCGSTPTSEFWEAHVLPALQGLGWSPSRANLRLICRGRVLHQDDATALGAAGVGDLSTIDVVGRLPSQGFPRLHQLVEHLLEMLAPAVVAGASAPPATDEVTSSREPIMHAIDAEIKRLSSWHGAAQPRPCSCLSCTQRPNSTLWMCGALLHSTDAAVVNIAFRIVQLLLHARTDCPAPPVYFAEESGALTLGAREAEFGHVYDAVTQALTPEGIAIAALLSQRLAYDAKTHPLLWQHPTKKQTLLEIAARSNHPGLLKSLLPALSPTRLAGSGARSAGTVAARARAAHCRPPATRRRPAVPSPPAAIASVGPPAAAPQGRAWPRALLLPRPALSPTNLH